MRRHARHRCARHGDADGAAAVSPSPSPGRLGPRPPGRRRGRVPPPGRAHRRGWGRWTAPPPGHPPAPGRPSGGCRRLPTAAALGVLVDAALHRRPGDGGLGLAGHLARCTYGSPWTIFIRQAAVDGGRDRRAARLRPHRLPQVAQVRAPAGASVTLGLLVAVLMPGLGVTAGGSSRWIGFGHAPAPALGAHEAGPGGLRRRHRGPAHRPRRTGQAGDRPGHRRPRRSRPP